MPERGADNAIDPLVGRAREILATRAPLPLPGSGDTAKRWRALARIGAEDLCLAKILEAHYDAMAILHELGAEAPREGELWAVWAAEPPHAMTRISGRQDDRCQLTGSKAWCSGAALVTHALITVHDDDHLWLAAVDLSAEGISPPAQHWNAVGMGRVVTGPLTFEVTPARLIGGGGAYLDRPGFWHGGGGVAACWYGAAVEVAEALRRHPRLPRDPHAAAHLGACDRALGAARALLLETARAIDAQPRLAHQDAVTRARLAVEHACMEVLERVGRALGPAPLCEDREHAQRCADLTVFVRQTHGERDLASLGIARHADEATPWAL